MRSTERPCNRTRFTATHQTTDDRSKTSRITPWRVSSATAITTAAMTTAALAADGETIDWQDKLIEWGVVIGALLLWSALFPPKKKKNGESEDSDGPDFDFKFSRRRRDDDKDGDGDGDGGGCGGGCGGGD